MPDMEEARLVRNAEITRLIGELKGGVLQCLRAWTPGAKL
jgi:hypothetical protein